MKKIFTYKLTLVMVSILLIRQTQAQTVTIGSGPSQNGTTISCPINNYYASNHCQILYTAAEINAGGLSAAGTITQLGFYIATSPSNALPNYTIKIKNTTATDAASYDGSGLTQVYTTASYAPVQGGYELLALNTPFVWDGVSNILLDVCSGLAAGTSSSGKVRTFAPVPAGTHYSYTRSNSVSQCGLPTNASNSPNNYGVITVKPQIRLVFTAPPACIAPSMSLPASITSSSATLSWSSPNPPPANGYHWEIVAAGTGTAGTIVASGTTAAGTTSAMATGLTDNTAYDAYVQSDCGGSGYSDYSASAGFTTLCNATGIPYAMNIASATAPALPACVTAEKLNAGNIWATAYNPPVSGFNGNALQYSYSTATAADAWVYTQGLNLTGGISYRLGYKYSNNGDTTYPEKMNVNYGTSPSSGAMGTMLANHPDIEAPNGPLTNTVDFVPPATGVYYIGFHAYSDVYEDILLLDSVTVKLTPCAQPSALTAFNININAADLSWAASPDSPANYDWEVRSSGIPGSGSAAASGTVAAPSLSVTATGLSASTTYSAYVRSNCVPGAYSPWTLATVFTTLCSPVNIPYVMDFASVTVPGLPTCVTAQAAGGSNAWQTVSNPGSGMSGNALVYNHSAASADTWAYTGGLNLSAGVLYRLSYRYNAGSATPEAMNVSYGTSPSAAAMSNALSSHPSIGNSPYAYRNTLSFMPATTGVYYIGFHAYSAANQDNLYVDSVSVIVCTTPTITVSASNTVICSGSTATLTAMGATTYTWDSGSNTAAIAVSPTADQSYTVSGSDVCGISAATETITVNHVPALTASASSASVCSMQNFTLSASGAANSYTWSSGAGTAITSVTAPMLTTLPATASTYTVTGTNNCGNGTATVSVMVNPSPAISASANATLSCAGMPVTLSASGSPNYTWTAGSPGGTPVATTATTVVMPTANTTYYVVGTYGNNCYGSAIVTVSVSTCTGIDALSGGDISIYPNPNNGVITVSIPATLSDHASIEVYDTPGKLVIREGLDTGATSINTSALEQGIYFYKIFSGSTLVYTGKLIRQ